MARGEELEDRGKNKWPRPVVLVSEYSRLLEHGEWSPREAFCGTAVRKATATGLSEAVTLLKS